MADSRRDAVLEEQNGKRLARVATEGFLSQSSKRWKPSSIRSLYPLEKKPGMVSLLAGKPNSSTFPFESITLKLKGKGETLTIEGEDLEETLQYGMTSGLPRLVDWLEAFQSSAHHRDRDGSWKVSVGVGSLDLISKTFRALLDPGDPVLLETPLYSGILGSIAPLELDMIEVEAGDTGLDSKALRKTLDAWPTARKKPRLLYTCPTGSNPTGRSATEEDRREILAICKAHNVLIMEDAAYDHLYFGDTPRALSYFELEPVVNGETGRVIRFDSFSKLISSGMRLGFMTASSAICDAVNLETSNTNLQASSTAQGILYALLAHWGQDGFLEHCRGVSDFYKKKCAAFEAAAHKHLDSLADWVSPVSGMFLFLRLIGVDDSFALIRTKAVEKGVLALPGVSFMPSESKTPFVRVSFSLATEDDAELAFSRLREVLLEEKASGGRSSAV